MARRRSKQGGLNKEPRNNHRGRGHSAHKGPEQAPEPTEPHQGEEVIEELFGEGADRRRILVKSDLNKRLDRYLGDRLKGISRSRIQKLIDLGGVTVNDQPPKASTLIRAGDVIDILLPPQAKRSIEPEEMPLDVLFEDEHCIVINKAANVIVHPARNHTSGTLLNGLAFRFKQAVEAAGGVFRTRETTGFHNDMDEFKVDDEPTDGSVEVKLDEGAVAGLSDVGAQEFRPGIIHRLDRYTTGCIVLAKQDEAHWGIARQFEDRKTLKAYLAVVHGNFEEAGGAIEEPIGRHPMLREAMAIRHDNTSRHALTLYRVREQYKGFALVELELKTGRTHQIRVHLSYLGHPIVGDIIYGGEPIGESDLDNPPVPAGARKFLTFARDKPEGDKIEADAKQRPDLIITHPALHAGLLGFTHPITKEVMRFNAPVHEPMATLIEKLRQRPHPTAPVTKQGYWLDLAQATPKGYQAR
jgi:23S rRNA pseudouridine1911/1915/1917 synthase